MSHLVVFVSGEGTNLQVLIDSIQSGIIQNTEISLVISNNKNAPARKRARKANIKTQVELFDRNNETRQDYDKRLYDIVSQYSPDLVKSVISFQKNHKTIKDTNKALSLSLRTMKKINERRQLMWIASRWKHYNDFRIFMK